MISLSNNNPLYQNLIIAFGKKPDLKNLVQELDHYASAPSWKNKNVTLGQIKNLIKKNERLILSQTENNENAPPLKNAMLDLSKRIFDENCGSSANKLAFEVQCYAMGLFKEHSTQKFQLSEDVLKNIFLKIPPERLGSKLCALKGPTWVSKNWHKLSTEVKQNWVSQYGFSLYKVSNCQTAKEAVEFIIKNKLRSANLSEYDDMTNADLTNLVKECPNLNSLYIESSKISEEKLAEALTKLPQLKSLGIKELCIHGHLSEALKMLKNLQHLSLNHCSIEGDNFAEVLKMHTQLKYLGLIKYKQFTDKLNEAIKMLSQLQYLNVGYCDEINEDKLAGLLKMLPQLQQLNIGHSSISGGTLDEVLKMLPHLKRLELYVGEYFPIKMGKCAEIKKTFPNLKITKM
jgi:hypothetical protein